MCKRQADGEYKVETYYNAFYSTSQVDSAQPSVGLSQISASLSGSYFSCSFRRLKKIDALESEYFNLNNPFYLIVAHGNIGVSGKSVCLSDSLLKSKFVYLFSKKKRILATDNNKLR